MSRVTRVLLLDSEPSQPNRWYGKSVFDLLDDVEVKRLKSKVFAPEQHFVPTIASENRHLPHWKRQNHEPFYMRIPPKRRGR